MGNVEVLRRLDEILEEASDLAHVAEAEMLIYLIEMAKLELVDMSRGNHDGEGEGPLVRITQHK